MGGWRWTSEPTEADACASRRGIIASISLAGEELNDYIAGPQGDGHSEHVGRAHRKRRHFQTPRGEGGQPNTVRVCAIVYNRIHLVTLADLRSVGGPTASAIGYGR